MNYLLVFRTNSQRYLVMTVENPHSIRAFDSKENVMKDFESFTEGWTQGTERSASCTIAMMNMCPIAIQAPENTEDIKKYLQEEKVYHITGGAMLGGYWGIPVKEEIMELQQFDIWKESMKLAGIAE